VNNTIQTALDEFVRALTALPEVTSMVQLQKALQSDPEVRALQDAYGSVYSSIARIQAEREPTEEELCQLKEAENAINSHPKILEFSETYTQVQGIMQSCNTEMSAILGFDFGGASAPGCCG
jgi:cell fate (sporulation/competence/biofilm development) regulator YlbF (YheA/YmcA/DUF963 family)